MWQAERRSEFQLSTKAETAEEAAETEAAEEEGEAGEGEGAGEEGEGAGEEEGEEGAGTGAGAEEAADTEAAEQEGGEGAGEGDQKQQSNKPRMSFCKRCFCSFGPLFPPGFYLSSVVRRFQILISIWSYSRFRFFQISSFATTFGFI